MPAASILLRIPSNGLGANPIAEAENELGLSALVFLIACIACTPAKRLFGWTWPIRIRRELGLLAFFYALTHFLTYMVLDQFFDFRSILADILQRPFITVGFTALVLLAPLAWTSRSISIRRMGYVNWQRLHWLIYPAGILAVVHFVWRVKRDVSQPLTYAFIVAVLLGVRLVFWLRKRYALGETLD
ncbi:MAG TPA: protein-methionine-sulfoxide reductase heme-binding subunit MsrQ [Chloroflexota bacterium]|jgi:sulfoxide reductase heme-binding subunit YedZ|nr:protein-methionine-sulfoxide reductase heme-binding subunit MsrQ [Chloroflexota bacterium]